MNKAYHMGWVYPFSGQGGRMEAVARRRPYPGRCLKGVAKAALDCIAMAGVVAAAALLTVLLGM